MVVLGAIALVLIILSSYTSLLDPVRARLANLSAPIYWLVDMPRNLLEWGQENFKSRSKLEEENASMRAQLLIHERKLQQLAVLAAENVRLRELLNSTELISDRVLVAELIGVSPDPLIHRITINKGSRQGVFVGQPLLDADGLMGQVVEVSDFSAQVLLITDSTHALPVQVNRNGVRAIVEGTGDLYSLNLRHLSNTVDIREGDLLISSGLGGRFPAGYPVAEVVSVVHDPGEPFATVVARPKAQLNRGRYVLLVFGSNQAKTAPISER